MIRFLLKIREMTGPKNEVDIVWKYDGVDPATIEYENRG